MRLGRQVASTSPRWGFAPLAGTSLLPGRVHSGGASPSLLLRVVTVALIGGTRSGVGCHPCGGRNSWSTTAITSSTRPSDGSCATSVPAWTPTPCAPPWTAGGRDAPPHDAALRNREVPRGGAAALVNCGCRGGRVHSSAVRAPQWTDSCPCFFIECSPSAPFSTASRLTVTSHQPT